MANILVYALSENFGGVEEYVLNLSRYKKGKDHQYGYILLGKHSPYEKELQQEGIKYYKIPTKLHLINNIIKTFFLLKELRKEYDVFYINTSSLGYILPYLIAYYLGYKLVLHSHSDASKTSSKVKILVHRINYHFLRKKIYKRLSCSKPAAVWMFGKDADKALIIPNAINLEKFKFNYNEREFYKKKLHLEQTKVIGNVGRLSDLKNQEFLLKLLAKFRSTNIKLLLVGDGESKEKLITHAKKLGIESKVIFYGRTQHPEKIMNVMDCIVMPSLVEGFPVSLVEAQAAGLPCIVSTNITREVDISHTLSFLSLKDPIEKWCELILAKIKLGRNNNEAALKKGGFDVFTLEDKVYKCLK